MLLIVLLIAGGSLSDVFFTPQNLLNILWAVSVLGIVALGQTMLLITCNFDMSVACVVGLSGIVTVVVAGRGAGPGRVRFSWPHERLCNRIPQRHPGCRHQG